MAKKTFTIVKDPHSVYPYVINWIDGNLPLLIDGDAIITSTWSIPDDIDQPTPPSISGGEKTVVWLGQGGEDGDILRVTNHVITANGLEEDAVLIIKIEDEF